ncbi:MAG: MBL fold metallo-hydrolase [Anaerolineae bacterium]|nr:MBL fold metallo-hydrolase [Anaerolineae bacterium]
MKLVFLGTRGYIEPRTQRHFRHSTTLVQYRGASIALDCGEDWLGLVDDWRVEAIFVTHAHPDHAWGLKNGAPCPVYATSHSWEVMRSFSVMDGRTVEPRRPIEIGRIKVEAFPVVHSTRAPAVGYRIGAGRVTIFYVPDVVYINDRGEALGGADLYVGDGATIVRSMVRKPGEELIGHTPIRTQLTWCQKEGVPRAIFTHCGSAIVAGDRQAVEDKVRALAQERGVRAEIAFDGMEVVLR